MPLNVWLLMAAQALNQCCAPMVVLVGGLIGAQLAPIPELVTLPVALMVVGVALATVPVSLSMQRWGRKRVFIAGNFVAIGGAILAAAALAAKNYWGFCAGTLLLGSSLAFVQQYRFAAMESVAPAQMPRAASRLLLAGLFAAFVGPELGVWGQNFLSVEYAGSFLALLLLNTAAIGLLLFVRDMGQNAGHAAGGGRSLGQIMGQPVFWAAVGAGAIGYALMSFIMTATPVSMHMMEGHSLADTKWVIQSHIMAMYLPSLLSGWLISRLGMGRIMFAGCCVYLLCITVASLGIALPNYWIGLILLGIGWNFLFVAGTALLPQSYRAEERFRVQGFNEAIVFDTQAVASLSSGWVLSGLGWHTLLLLGLPLVFVQLFLLLIWRRSSQKQP
jgi:MFS family permease